MKKSFRPTKAASKRRRDMLNTEISCIRNVLPVTEVQRQKLSQLQVMSLSSAYISLNNFVTHFVTRNDCSEEIVKHLNVTQILPGFLLVLANDGRVLYVSDNISDYLGYTPVELLTQGETVYDFVENCDQSDLRVILESVMSSDVIPCDLQTVTCRMFLAQNFRNLHGFSHCKMMEMKGRVLKKPVSAPDGYMPEAIFVAVVVPHSKPSYDSWAVCSFQSVHSLDMRYTAIDHNGCILLGYDPSEIESKSWYESIHPDDIAVAEAKHFEVLQHHEPGITRSICVRIQTCYGYFVWLQMVMFLRESNNKQEIVCNNCVLKEMDAAKGQNCKETNNPNRCVAYPENMRVPSTPELFFGELCQAQRSENKMYHAVHATSSSCMTGGEIAVQTSLKSPYPLLKQILNRPAIQAFSMMRPEVSLQAFSMTRPEVSLQAFSMTRPEVSLAESLLTPQNSPSDLGQQDFLSSENCLLHTGIPTPEYLSSDFDPSETSSASLVCNDRCFVQKQHSAVAPPEFGNTVEPSSVHLESQTLCFADDEYNVSIEAIVDALTEMQNDPEISKELESIDLSVFCESFPRLETRHPSGTKIQDDFQTASLSDVLMPYLDLSLTKLSSAQIENLNKRLSELKKLHETMIFKAVVDILHDDGSGALVNLPVSSKENLTLSAEYKTGFGFARGISSYENCQSCPTRKPEIYQMLVKNSLD